MSVRLLSDRLSLAELLHYACAWILFAQPEILR